MPGDYQLRYYHGELRKVIATRPLQVVAAEVALTAPDEVAMASRITVGWTGPGARFDEVQVFDPSARGGDGQVIDSQRVTTDQGAAQRQATVVAPAVPGDYHLRYYNGDNRKVLVTRPLRVVAAEVSLEAPASVPMASRVTIGWTGPGARFDEVQLFDPAAKNGDGRLVDSQRVTTDKGAAQRQATVVAPAVPGDYELRYYNGDNRKVLATRPLTVTAIEVSLQAPDRAPADSPITVRWTGPGAAFDNIEIHDPAARTGEGQLVVNRRVVNDPGYAQRQVTLRTPKVAGTYQLRYYNGDNRAVLATRPLIVE